jgi:excisionase family DNA binding protein
MTNNISLENLPTWVKLEVSKADLEAFAKTLLAQNTSQSATPSLSAKALMSVEDAAKFLNLAKTTLYQLTSRNEIPFVKRTRKLYFSRADLENWLLEGTQKSKKEIEKEAILFIQTQKIKRAKK